MTYSVPGQIRTHLVSSSTIAGTDSPFSRTQAVLDMMKGWEIMKAVTLGTEYLRENSETFLPIEPREDYTAYLARVNRAVFSPFTQRLVRAAAGLILRKPISLVGDPYWTDVFAKNVDGSGSDLDEYARRMLTCSLTYGHCHTLVLDREVNYGDLVQVRIKEKAVVPDGEFGEKVYDQIRVIEPGRYRVFRQVEASKAMSGGFPYPNAFDATDTTSDYELVESGQFSLGEIPLVTTYADKVDTLTSKPPLLDIAYLNLAHFQRQADLIHSLHIASQPILVMEGWDDQTKDTAVSVNYAMATAPGNKIYYVEPAASAFEAQSAEIKELQMQMATLGISTLSQQKFVAESADARRLDRIDTNSMLSSVSMDLEQSLQRCFNIAATYVGIEPPEVQLSRDFNIERLIGQDIAALTSLFDQGVLGRDEFRQILVQGEILPTATEGEEIEEVIEPESTEEDTEVAQ
jgi:hypothetical protein